MPKTMQHIKDIWTQMTKTKEAFLKTLRNSALHGVKRVHKTDGLTTVRTL